jgi:ubiquinone/menaquinone biosynthesis C-methylase UbiE
MAPQIIRTCESLLCVDERWEQAYLRFESPRQEISKFRTRLKRLGMSTWPRNSRIVELFCGRGNGLKALADDGFYNIEGVDLSEDLLSQYQGDATLYVADCRKLPFADSSVDIMVVQGGLHHLPLLPTDLELVLIEVNRVLRLGGRLVIVEPWLTSFLQLVHLAARQKLLRRMWGKLDAFATMVEREEATYMQWLSMPTVIIKSLDRVFTRVKLSIAFGKVEYVGVKR